MIILSRSGLLLLGKRRSLKPNRQSSHRPQTCSSSPLHQNDPHRDLPSAHPFGSRSRGAIVCRATGNEVNPVRARRERERGKSERFVDTGKRKKKKKRGGTHLVHREKLFCQRREVRREKGVVVFLVGAKERKKNEKNSVNSDRGSFSNERTLSCLSQS